MELSTSSSSPPLNSASEVQAAVSRSPPRTPAPPSAPSPLCTSLPSGMQRRVDAFLGFSLLMDLRALCRDMQLRCEQAALRWMRRHLSADGLRERNKARTRRREAARASVAPEVDCWRNESDKPNEQKQQRDSAAQPAVSEADAADFDVSDVVWLRRQLDRWGHCSRDAELCIITPRDAKDAYDRQQQLGKRALPSLWDHGVRCDRVVDIAQVPFSKHKHATAIDAAIQSEVSQRSVTCLSSDDRLHLEAEQQVAKTAAARWTASSAGAPWLSQLSTDVLAHSVLGFLDFEQLMGTRAVSCSKSRKPSTECASTSAGSCSSHAAPVLLAFHLAAAVSVACSLASRCSRASAERWLRRRCCCARRAMSMAAGACASRTAPAPCRPHDSTTRRCPSQGGSRALHKRTVVGACGLTPREDAQHRIAAAVAPAVELALQPHRVGDVGVHCSRSSGDRQREVVLVMVLWGVLVVAPAVELRCDPTLCGLAFSPRVVALLQSLRAQVPPHPS